MAEKQTGLGTVDIEGAASLWPQSSEAEERPQKAQSGAKRQAKKQPGKVARVKKNLTLSQETIDLLDLLKPAYRKKEGRFVPEGNIIDIAIAELAKKMKIELR